MPNADDDYIQLRAVQYLRMSTEHQRYSLESQAATNAAYALSRGFEIVRTYSDAGRSGLTLSGRKGLQTLLSDALNPDRDFCAILVLDVSRWGRFQDPDQSAHYEFVCRQAGVTIAYCGEPFENDGAISSSIIKHLKRVMAGEYSRELSAKVTQAHLRQARLGFRQGGPVPYGFRRQLVDAGGILRHRLERGQRKAVQADRIVLALGPADEIETVRRIFHDYVVGRDSVSMIARALNDRGVPTETGKPWSPHRVLSLLANEAYIGNYVYNRTSTALKSARRRRPVAEWVRTAMLPPVISPRQFEEAQKIAAQGRGNVYSDRMLLAGLRSLLKRERRLSGSLIEACRELPGVSTYNRRFGGLVRAYQLAGYKPPNLGWSEALKAHWTVEVLLAGLKRLHARHGAVSAKLILSDTRLPCVNVFVKRFGSLSAAYARAGLVTSPSGRALPRRVASVAGPC